MLQTVMIADDSMPLHALVKAYLEPDCLNIHSVYDGSTAIATAGSLKPDLILLDIDMPQMDGFETCRSLKADPKTSSIPIIFLSADAISTDKTKGLGLGAIDYIVKPFKPDELIQRVRSTLQPQPVSTDSRLTDPLTGLGNKTLFAQDLASQFKGTGEQSEPLACTVVEIDQIGMIVCKYGPPVANQIIRTVAGVLSTKVGAESKVYCLTNRRFAILSTNTDRFTAANTAKALKATLDHSFSSDRGADIHVTCSFGISDTSIATLDALLDRATVVVERASNSGGNCVSIARAASRNATAA